MLKGTGISAGFVTSYEILATETSYTSTGLVIIGSYEILAIRISCSSPGLVSCYEILAKENFYTSTHLQDI